MYIEIIYKSLDFDHMACPGGRDMDRQIMLNY